MLAIVAPMTTELAGIRREAHDADRRGASFHVSGIGQGSVSASMKRIMAEAPDAVIMAGFCGAADPGLKTGDLHVADFFQAAASGVDGAIAAHVGLTAGLTHAARGQGCRVVTAPSATVDSVADAAAKSAAHAALGAASVNMEDYWAAAAASAAGVPFASVRAVLDTADQELPAWLSLYAESASRVVWSLLAHPARFLTLLRLARQSGVARRQLTRCVLASISALTPPQPFLTASLR